MTMPYRPNPRPETLAEFATYTEVLKAAGEAAIALDDALMVAEARANARSARRPSREEVISHITSTRR